MKDLFKLHPLPWRTEFHKYGGYDYTCSAYSVLDAEDSEVLVVERRVGMTWGNAGAYGEDEIAKFIADEIVKHFSMLINSSPG